MAVTIMRTVRPSSAWQDTLIRLQKGQRVVIDAEETWSPDMRDQIVWCGADGVYKLVASEGYLLPGANVGALLGRIGSGAIFAIGSRYDFVVGEEGVLYLAMNEDSKRNNQAGKLVAQVIVFDEP
ncbi:MAG: hypothetical protein GKR89_08570 [Candidatus Latescibacteria bacterium]|nr:hypothetical protein [Candidatus Latescibacterota bacterium]